MKPEEAFSVTIPPEWRSVPFWSLFRRRKQTGYVDEELLSVYRDHGIIPKASRDDNHNKASEDLSNYQLVTEGALVTNKMKAWQGSIGISRYRGIVSPAYYVYEPLSRENDQYLHYLLRSHPYIGLYGRISKGIRVDQWDLEHEALRNIPIILPEIDQQRTIADFLDRETARIDQLIEKKQRLVELLEEKRKAEAERLITFGIGGDSNVVKTGFKWAPCVSENVKLLPIKRVARLYNGYAFDSNDLGELGVPVIRIGDVKPVIDTINARKFIGERIVALSSFKVVKGDILIAMTGATIGKFGVYQNDNHSYLNQRVGLFRTFDTDHSYFTACLETQIFIEQMKLYAFGGAQPNIGASQILSIILPFAKRNEQAEIGERIAVSRNLFRQLKLKVGQSIDRLREFHSALITAAVTGQIDVNEWSRRGHSDAKLDAIAEKMEE